MRKSKNWMHISILHPVLQLYRLQQSFRMSFCCMAEWTNRRLAMIR